jgi:hypothetical protein
MARMYIKMLGAILLLDAIWRYNEDFKATQVFIRRFCYLIVWEALSLIA